MNSLVSPTTNIIDTEATASAFGWDFQVNTAIYFALKNIKHLVSIKVEGKIEDIELNMQGNKNIYIQVKSHTDPSSKANTLVKLQDALKTLINATNQSEYEELHYVSNSFNPLNDKKLDAFFTNPPVKYSYNELNNSAQKIIDKYISAVEKKYTLNVSKLDKNKIFIHAIPFFGNDDSTRYRIMSSSINEFLSSVQLSGKTPDLLEYWQNLLNLNSTIKQIKVNKEQLIWPIIILDSLNISHSKYNYFFEDFDLGQIDEIHKKYNLYINKKTQQFSFVTQVINDFTQFKTMNKHIKNNQQIEEFSKEKWKIYASIISEGQVHEEIKEIIIKLIILQILKNRYSIDDIKRMSGI